MFYQFHKIPHLLLALILGMLIESSESQEVTLEDLQKAIQRVSEKLDNLEKVLLPRLKDIEEKQATISAAANLEIKAKAEFDGINKLLADDKFDEAKLKVADFMKKYRSTKFAGSLIRVQRELEVFGKKAPEEWGIEKWFQGEEEIDFNQNTTTLFVFWEVWCPHCVREVPKLQKLYTKYKQSGLQVVALTKISKSATEEKVADFINEKGVQYPVAKEDGSISKYFNVAGIPAAAVIHNGVIVWRGHPARLKEKLLMSWL